MTPAILEPRQLGAVVEVVDDLVAARERRGHVELATGGLGGARDAPRLASACAGRSSAFDGMHA